MQRNIREALKHKGIAYEEIERKRGRIYIKTKNPKETADALTQVFGVSSVSPAIQTTADIKSIVQTAVNLTMTTIKSENSFAVRCSRVGKHPFSSMDVCRTVGEQILKNQKDRKLRVDLENPQFTINIEVRDEQAYVFSETLQGAGGFPMGSQPKIICLLSGGIDSAAACWLAMKRGCPIIPIYLDNTPFTDEKTTTKALDISKKLFEWSIGFSRKIYIIPHGKNLETFVKRAPRKLTCILCKRMMYRIAERIAEIENAEGIVTGEAIGEQASQTLTNLRVLNEASEKYPIHRPLLGFDKTETTTLARKIGTLEISTRRAKGCSAAPSKPSTQAKLENLKNTEKRLDIETMVEESIKAAKALTV